VSSPEIPVRHTFDDRSNSQHDKLMSIETNVPPRATGYLLLFRSTGWERLDMSEGEIRQMMEKVNAWFDGLSATGKLVSAQPLMEEGVVITGKGGGSVTDGPFAEAKEVIGGYVLLSVDTMEEAVALAQTNPMHEFGLTTEVRPTASNCPHLHRALSRLAEAAA
jgi:hypothetical protein